MNRPLAGGEGQRLAGASRIIALVCGVGKKFSGGSHSRLDLEESYLGDVLERKSNICWIENRWAPLSPSELKSGVGKR